MDDLHHIASQDQSPMEPPPLVSSTPPPLPPVAQPQVAPLRKLLGWIVTVSWACCVLTGITIVPEVMHSLHVWGVVDDDISLALSYPANDQDTAFENETSAKPGKDFRSSVQKEKDEDAFFRVIGGAPEYWIGEDDEDVEELSGYEGAISKGAAGLAVSWLGIVLFLTIALTIFSVTGAVMTLVLIGKMVLNARIVDSGHKHASVAWAVGSCFVPIAQWYVPVREMLRAWRGLAVRGAKTAGGLVVLWWVINIVSSITTQVVFRATMRDHLLPHWFELANDLLIFLFYILCVLVFTRMRKTIAE